MPRLLSDLAASGRTDQNNRDSLWRCLGCAIVQVDAKDGSEMQVSSSAALHSSNGGSSSTEDASSQADLVNAGLLDVSMESFAVCDEAVSEGYQKVGTLLRGGRRRLPHAGDCT